MYQRIALLLFPFAASLLACLPASAIDTFTTTDNILQIPSLQITGPAGTTSYSDVKLLLGTDGRWSVLSFSAAPVTTPVIAAAGQNVLPIVVDAGPAALLSSGNSAANIAYATVTVCQPGNSSNCQNIDHVLIDTGSSGLRLFASTLPAALNLTPVLSSSGSPVAECTQFVDGYTWGSVKLADVKLAGEVASSIPIQVIADPAFLSVPTSCSSSGPSENTVVDFGANGVLGISVFKEDCGNACASQAISGTYYACASNTCRTTALPLTKQVANPIAYFGGDNNGSVISLPSVPATGTTSISGTLTFGIGTQSNNTLTGASVYTVNANTGNFTTLFNSKNYNNSFLDTGSNGLFVATNSIAPCTKASVSGFYCPASTLNLSAVNSGLNGTSSTINFSIGNADILLNGNPTFAVFGNLGGSISLSSSFDWGLPFFYGRTVYTALEGGLAGGTSGPYVAY